VLLCLLLLLLLQVHLMISVSVNLLLVLPTPTLVCPCTLFASGVSFLQASQPASIFYACLSFASHGNSGSSG
jgi:hypothetical protein